MSVSGTSRHFIAMQQCGRYWRHSGHSVRDGRGGLAHATSSAQFAIDPLHRANANAERCRNLTHARSVFRPERGLYCVFRFLVYSGTTKPLSLAPGPRQPGADPFLNHRALEFAGADQPLCRFASSRRAHTRIATSTDIGKRTAVSVSKWRVRNRSSRPCSSRPSSRDKTASTRDDSLKSVTCASSYRYLCRRRLALRAAKGRVGRDALHRPGPEPEQLGRLQDTGALR